MSEGLSGAPQPPWKKNFEIIKWKTKHAQGEAELRNVREKVATDELTGLASRRFFMERAQSALDNLYVGRQKEQRQRIGIVPAVSIIGIDLDHFGAINNDFGHPVGDKVLQKVAATLMENVRSIDVVGRVGGEEITILFLGPLDVALKKADDLRAAIQALRFEEMGEKEVTASFGVAAVGPDEQPTLEVILERADDALRAAKKPDATHPEGRNRVVEYSTLKQV